MDAEEWGDSDVEVEVEHETAAAADGDAAAAAAAAGESKATSGDVVCVDTLPTARLADARVWPMELHYLINSQYVGRRAVWALSGAKPGSGVRNLHDDDLSTFWQSDGEQPHTITVQFHSTTPIIAVALYLNHGLDESYTPEHVSLRAGTCFHDLHEVERVKLVQPCGWVVIRLGEASPRRRVLAELRGKGDARGTSAPLPSVRAGVLQIVILGMHQKGRDTRVRQVKLLSPRDRASTGSMAIPATAAAVHGGAVDRSPPHDALSTSSAAPPLSASLLTLKTFSTTIR